MYNYLQLHKHSTVYIYTRTYNAQMWLCDPALRRYGGDEELKLSIFVDTALLIKAAAGGGVMRVHLFPSMRRTKTRLTRQKIHMQPQTWRDKLLWHGWAQSVHEGMQQINVGSQ